MKKIVGVRFRHTGKSYYFDANDLDLTIGNGVIIKSEDGNDYGVVSIPPMEREEEKLPAILKQIVRKATEEDDSRLAENMEMEKEAYRVGKEKIVELNLPMKLIQAEYTFDRNKLLFYFSAEGRVDFRELVRVLASVFKTRIELRQIGVRDEAKMLGGIGICGRPLCCSTYLSDFAPVSIKMAKEQNLSLNPTKISGLCGRLMCCLGHEEETYEYLNKTMPRNGDFVVNAEGIVGVIRSVNILKQSVLVMFEEGDTREMKEYNVDDISVTPRREGVPSDAKIAAQQVELQKKLDSKIEKEILESEKADTKSQKDIKPTDQRNKNKQKNSANNNNKSFEKKNENLSQNKNNQNKKDKRANKNRELEKKNNVKEEKEKKNSLESKEIKDSKEAKDSKNNRTKDNRDRRNNKNNNNKNNNNNKKNKNNKNRSNKGDFKEKNNRRKKTGQKSETQNTKNENKNDKEKQSRRNGGYSRGYRGDRKK